MIEKIHDVIETAAIMNVSKHTVRVWYYRGLLKGIKLGRRLMFSETSIQNFIDRGKK